MRRSPGRLLLLMVTLAATLIAGSAVAGSYKGFGETGFVHDRKRDCCDDAVALAAEDSALSCERAGGFADYDPRRVRGSCESEWRQDRRGTPVYSCRSAVTVRCR